MKKYEITITETLTYSKKAIVSVPEEMSDAEFDKLLDRLERQADSSNDLPYVAKRLNVDMTLVNPDDWSSPDRSEIEIEDYTDVKD